MGTSDSKVFQDRVLPLVLIKSFILMSKKILFLHSSSDLYGASRIFLQTILHLKNEGVTPIVVLSGKGPLAEEFSKHQIKVHFIRLGVLRRKYMNPIGLVNRLFFLINAVIKLKGIIRQESVDLTYNNASSIISGLIASRLTGTPHLWHVHEIIVNPKWFAHLVAKLLGHSNRVLVVSKATRNHWVKINSKLEKNTVVVHNGLNSQYLSNLGSSGMEDIKLPYKDTIWIGMIARVHFWKGQSYFLDLASRISKNHNDVMFLMAGDAFPGYEYLYEEIEGKIETLGLKEKVINLGLVEDSRDFYPLIDLMILPSILPDPLPTTCLEAMAHALPVVATNHGGALEMVEDGRTGVLIPFDNAERAYELMAGLLTNRTLADQYGKAGREKLLSEFSIASYNKELTALMTNMIGDE